MPSRGVPLGRFELTMTKSLEQRSSALTSHLVVVTGDLVLQVVPRAILVRQALVLQQLVQRQVFAPEFVDLGLLGLLDLIDRPRSRPLS